MVRTQIQLTDKQSQELKRIASEKKVSIAEVIRQAVDELLAKQHQPDIEELRRRAIAASGSGHSGITDLARRHDDYLDEVYGN